MPPSNKRRTGFAKNEMNAAASIRVKKWGPGTRVHGKRESHGGLPKLPWCCPKEEVMANHVGPSTSHRQGYKMASALPADSSETLQLSQRNDEPERATKTRDRYIL